jgi:hypothetical protein
MEYLMLAALAAFVVGMGKDVAIVPQDLAFAHVEMA